MIVHQAHKRPEVDKPKQPVLYSASGMAKLVRRLREAAKLPATFTLDACRHGGMMELGRVNLRAAPSALGTKAELMRITPSAPWNGLLRRPVSDTHIGSRVIRTSREQNFRMALRNRFRMNSKNKP
jgi:hypothetical protein